MISDDAKHALKARHPVNEVAGQWVRLRKRGRRGYIGPCPMCSEDPQSRSATRFECDANGWVCAVCGDGGDVIKLVAKRQGVDFRAAIEWLGGAVEEKPTPTTAERRGAADQRAGAAERVPDDLAGDAILAAAWTKGFSKAKRQADYADFARRREVERLREFLRQARPWRGSLVERYLAARGLVAPDNARLRLHPAMPYMVDGREQSECIHRGPAMLAPILGTAGGLHITWLAADGAGKAALDPAKKVRGSKQGGYIDLGGCPAETATRMIAGEGIETVLAVYTALVRAGRDVSNTNFRSGVDLGNLAGRATGTVAHPTLKTAQGRAQRVPGPTADTSSPAMPVPDQVVDLVLLGDGDSEPFLTRNALERARARHSRDGRAVRVRFAPAGFDFNDLLKRDKENAA